MGCPALTCSTGASSPHLEHLPHPHPPLRAVTEYRGIERRKNFDCRQKWDWSQGVSLVCVFCYFLALEGCTGFLQVEEEEVTWCPNKEGQAVRGPCWRKQCSKGRFLWWAFLPPIWTFFSLRRD